MINETNITIDIAKISINSQLETYNYFDIFTKLAIPIISILVVGFVTYYNVKNSTRNIFIQANEAKIHESITKLSILIGKGRKDQILAFLNSSEGIYIPEPIKSDIRKLSQKNIDDENIKNNMYDSISKYISP